MSQVPTELKYTSSHEWCRLETDGSISVGITEHAQSLLGDMVFVELPELEDEVGAGDDVAVAESVKAASDIYAPVAGQIVAINEQLVDEPELVNADPFGNGWLFRLKPSEPSALDSLLDAAGYQSVIDEE